MAQRMTVAAAVRVRNAALCSPVKPDVMMYRRSPLNSPLHPAIFFGSVKFVDLGVLYFSLVLPGQARWRALGLRGIEVLGRFQTGRMYQAVTSKTGKRGRFLFSPLLFTRNGLVLSE